MKLDGNTILITGGTSGIGKGLAEAFHTRGNQVILSGRREGELAAICQAHPGMKSLLLDVTDPASIERAAAEVGREFPALNCVISNAGVQKAHDFSLESPLDEAAMLAEVDTNLLGVIRVASAFLPLLRRQSGSTLVHVSSGLAFVPLAMFPIYCATKAAVHSFTMSLRHQLRGTAVKVVELIPPYVATNLGRESKAGGFSGPQPMPLEDFIVETLQALATDEEELAIGQASGLKAAAVGALAAAAFSGMNSR